MGVKIRKRGGKWYVFVNYHGKRKAKCVGSSRELAEQVRRQLEAKLAFGDLGFLQEAEKTTFGNYADRWLKQHAELHCKPSTISGYKAVLRLHVRPSFEKAAIDRISRDDVKELLAKLSAKGLSANTLKNALIVLRVILNSAVDDGLVQANAATKMGRFLPADPEKFEPVALTREEAQLFLEGVDADFQLLFLTLLRTGMRWGEAAALRWGDIQFGTSEEDQNRFIWVRRNWVHGKFTSPKSKKTRRIDLSRQLRRALLEARDTRMLNAYLKGHANLSDELVFPSEAGSVLDHSNVYSRHFLPAIERAGLRHVRIHDLRHTFASQLLQDGASLAYVRDQLGHSSISVTVDLYGHLVPSANIAWVDRLDRQTSPQQNATPAQLGEEDEQDVSLEVLESNGGPGQSRTADLRFRKPLLYPSELRGLVNLPHYLMAISGDKDGARLGLRALGPVRLARG
jgi:integrase